MKSLLLAFALLFVLSSQASAACTVARGNGNVWKVTGTTATAQVILPQSSSMKIKAIYWFSPDAIDDLLNITDAAGNSIGANFEASNSTQSQVKYFNGLVVDGLAVQDMDSGEIHIQFSSD